MNAKERSTETIIEMTDFKINVLSEFKIQHNRR